MSAHAYRYFNQKRDKSRSEEVSSAEKGHHVIRRGRNQVQDRGPYTRPLAEPPLKEPEKTIKDYSDKFSLAPVNAAGSKQERETDVHRLSQRQKQVDYGKNTLGYERYLKLIPRYKRQRGHPRTPDIHQVCSKRSWDGQIKKWRAALHEFDPPVQEDEELPEMKFVPGYKDTKEAERQLDDLAEAVPVSAPEPLELLISGEYDDEFAAP